MVSCMNWNSPEKKLIEVVPVINSTLELSTYVYVSN